MNNPSFTCLQFENGKLYEDRNIVVHGFESGTFYLDEGTYFVFVYKGMIWLNGDTPLKGEMYACLNVGILRTDFGSRALIIQDKTWWFWMRRTARACTWQRFATTWREARTRFCAWLTSWQA